MERPGCRLQTVFSALLFLPLILVPACTGLGAWDVLRNRAQLGTKRISLTFDNSLQGEDLIDFPALVVLKTGFTNNYQDFGAGGIDLRFVDPADPGRLLDHEIELWDPAGDSFVWVRVPRIDAGSISDHIWMYFGNPGLEESGENPRGLWSDYRLVYHLSPHPQEEIFDSGPGAYHGTPSLPPGFEAAKVGDGFRTSDALNRFIDTGFREDLPRWTVEAWVRAAAPPGTSGDSNLATGPLMGRQKYDLVWDHQGWNGRVHCRDSSDSSRQADFCAVDGPLAGGQWYYLAGVYDDASETLRAFRDGVLQAEEPAVAGPLAPLAADVHVGNWPGTALVLDGIVDEVRIQGEVRSADWIRAQHLCMTDAFISYGGIEELEE